MRFRGIYYVILCVILLPLFSAKEANAFSSVVGVSKIIPQHQTYIDGIKVVDPQKETLIGSNNPTFFGYTLSNVTLSILIENDHIHGSTISDTNGYWIYNMEKTLSPGVHKLYVTITDSQGASSESELIGTFKVPAVLDSSTRKIIVPEPSLRHLDYLTVSLIIFGFVFLLVVGYFFAKRHKHVDE